MLNALKTIGKVIAVPLKMAASKVLWPLLRDHLWDVVLPLVGYTLKRTLLRKGSSMKNSMEALVRGIAEAIQNAPDSNIIDIVGMVRDMFGPIAAVWGMFSDSDNAALKVEFKEAFDHLVGSEPDALIGPGQLVNTDSNWLTEKQQEQLSDLFGGILAEVLFPDESP